jgi:hypothetical protein
MSISHFFFLLFCYLEFACLNFHWFLAECWFQEPATITKDSSATTKTIHSTSHYCYELRHSSLLLTQVLLLLECNVYCAVNYCFWCGIAEQRVLAGSQCAGVFAHLLPCLQILLTGVRFALYLVAVFRSRQVPPLLPSQVTLKVWQFICRVFCWIVHWLCEFVMSWMLVF